MPDNILNSVVFIGARTGTGPQYGGTAFFVAVPYGNGTTWRYDYLVTAKHNLDQAAATSGTLLIRPMWADMTRNDVIETRRSEWLDHPEADVSVLDLDVPGLRYSPLDYGMFLTDELREMDNVGVGDEIQVVGLFVGHRGVRRNVPIVRTGIVAAMPNPEEPVLTRLGEMEAYLAEVRSIGGLSGSPVFVVLPPFRRKQSAPSHEARAYLLGLVHGHWDQELPRDEYVESVEAERINQGIAVVIPATRVLDLIDAHREVEKRKAAWDEHERTARGRG